jgi:uncharacterized protein (TIGR03435 family)
MPNPPGTADQLTPPSSTFEVASLRPSRPEEQLDANLRNGRVEVRAFPLRQLIALAYNTAPEFVRGEKWIENDRYDIVAKTDAAALESLRGEFASLLEERFALKVHRDSEAMSVYALTAPKANLKPADPSGRSGCHSFVVDGAKSIRCVNATIDQFAASLHDSESTGYIDFPVVNLTGMAGAFDLELTWAPKGKVMRPGDLAAPADGAITASAPRAGLTVFEALEKQLGLKLVKRNHDLPVLVIDSIRRNPGGN